MGTVFGLVFMRKVVFDMVVISGMNWFLNVAIFYSTESRYELPELI